MAIYTFPETILGLSKFTLKAWAIWHLVITYGGYPVETIGPSMLPTLNPRGDHVWTDSSYRRGRGIRVGDAISFKHPLVPGEAASKRVIGMPGDWIVADEEGRMLKVPKGHCWVEGDHWAWSRDSRFYGPLPLALIKGKIVARIRPFSQRKWMANPFDG